MSEIRTLLGLELRSLYGINKTLHTKDKKAKRRYVGLGIVWVFLILMIAFYVAALVVGYCTLGLGEIVPLYLTVLASLLILAFGLFGAGHRIFGRKGYDILASMPIKPRAIVISRFLCLYLEDLLLTALILLPGMVTWGICLRPAVGAYFVAFAGLLLIPAIPLVLSVLFGTLILAISSRMRKKSLWQTVLMLTVALGAIVFSTALSGMSEEFDPDRFSELAGKVGAMLEKLYPPAAWLGNSIVKFDLWGLLLFVLVSCAVMLLALVIVSKCFRAVMLRLSSFGARSSYRIGAMESRSLLKALYVRELKRYFSSAVYVTNTIIGPIMGMLAALALCVVGWETVTATLPLGIDLVGLLPFAFAAILCMMTTTSTSISMEGKQITVIKSLPIPTKALLDSKLLLNLTLMLPCYLVSELALILAIRPTPLQLLWLLVIPLLIMLFSTVFGITVNLKFHSFDWEKEETVVKQSLPAALGGFAGVLLSLLLGALTLLVPAAWSDAAKLAVCALLGIGTLLLYHANNQKELAVL